VIWVFARYEEVRFADGIGLRIEFLSVYLDIYLRIDILQHSILSNLEHSSDGTCSLIDFIHPYPHTNTRLRDGIILAIVNDID